MADRRREDDADPWHARPTQREQHGRASSSHGRWVWKEGDKGFDRGKSGGGWDRGTSPGGKGGRAKSPGVKDADKGFDRGKSGGGWDRGTSSDRKGGRAKSPGVKDAGKGFDRGKSGGGWDRGTSSDRKGGRAKSPGVKDAGKGRARAVSPPRVARQLQASKRPKTVQAPDRASAASVSPPRTVADSSPGDGSYYSQSYSTSEDCVLDMTACL